MTPHCESCGKENPQMIEGEGYTVCCNELLCTGPRWNKWTRRNEGLDKFGTEDNYVKACCWAMAEVKFKEAGKDIPDGASRLF